MREHRVDGLLLAPAEGTDPAIIDDLRRSGLPVVQMLRRVGKRNADHVSADFRLGMTLAAEHLIRLGHKRIAFVGGGRRTSPLRDRATAYRETLARYGLPVGPIVHCLPTREEGARAVAELMRGKRVRPDGDPLLQRPLRLRRACSASPTAVSWPAATVPSSASTTSPRPLSTARRSPTIAIGARRIGEEAANLLLRRIKAPNGAPESIVLPPKLIVRSSCGGKPTHH